MIKPKCEKCGQSFETLLGFDSIGTYDDDHYNVGDKVDTNSELMQGERYHSWVSIYCDNCYSEWSFDQFRYAYQVLSNLVQKGRIIVKLGSDILSAEDIDNYVKNYIDEMKNAGWYSAPIGGVFQKLDFIYENQQLYAPSEMWMKFLDEIEPLINEKLKTKGWLSGKNTCRQDYYVVIDQNNRIFIEDSKGDKVFGNKQDEEV
ncbi:MAG: hypothetical protein JNN15_16385 [Blastocatellia bacterium]|nr:hypothetical protein [Blastocatellia bacterium]